MVYKYLIAIAALITVAMLISFLPGHIKQNTAITSIKGFTAYTLNGLNYDAIYTNGGTQLLKLPSHNKFYYAVSFATISSGTYYGSGLDVNFQYTDNADANTTYPKANTFYSSSQGNNPYLTFQASGLDVINTSNVSGYYSSPYTTYDVYNGVNTQFAVFIGVNSTFTTLTTNSTYNYSFMPVKNQFFIIMGSQSISYSSNLDCTNIGSFGIAYVCYAKEPVLTWAGSNSINNNHFYITILAQQPQTLTFSSTFSYISSSGVVPACYYNNPYKPLVYVNGTLESVTEGSPTQINSSGNLARFDSLYGYGGHNYRNNSGASYQILANGQLNKPDLWITVPKSLSWIYTPINSLVTNGGYQSFSTIPFNPAELAQATLFYSDQQYLITKLSQIQTAVDYLTGSIQGATYTELYQNGTVEQLLKPVFSFTALLSNSTRLLYTNITLQIRIPSNFSTSNISQITDPNLTISYGTDIPNSNYYFYIMPAAYYKEVAAHAANNTYILGTNSTHSGIVYTIPLNKSQIKLVKDTDGFINLNVPAILVFNLNNSDPTGGYYNNVNKSFTAMYYAASYKFSYKIAAPQYTVSLLNAGSKINVTYDSGNTTVMSVYNSKENMSYLDTLNGNSYNSNILLWSYNLNDITYNLEFTSLLNSKLWTSNSIINYNGKNYTTGSNGYINVPVTAGSKINFIDYVFYNTGYEKVQYTNFVTMPYNPCDPITTYAYSLSNTAYINGTIIGTVTGTGQNKTSTGSTGPSTTTTPPSNIMSLSYWEYQLKEWGILFGSIIVMGLIAFKFGVDKKGVQNPQVMAIAAIIFVALNLFGLAEGLGNIYITGILVFLAAIIMFEMLLKIFHRGGN